MRLRLFLATGQRANRFLLKMRFFSVQGNRGRQLRRKNPSSGTTRAAKSLTIQILSGIALIQERGDLFGLYGVIRIVSESGQIWSAPRAPSALVAVSLARENPLTHLYLCSILGVPIRPFKRSYGLCIAFGSITPQLGRLRFVHSHVRPTAAGSCHASHCQRGSWTSRREAWPCHRRQEYLSQARWLSGARYFAAV